MTLQPGSRRGGAERYLSTLDPALQQALGSLLLARVLPDYADQTAFPKFNRRIGQMAYSRADEAPYIWNGTAWAGWRARRLQDADNDTWIDVENAPDEDKIRLTVAGVERLLLQTVSPHLKLTGDVGISDVLVVGSQIMPTGVRMRVITWKNLGVGDSRQLQVSMTGTQTANAGQRFGFDFVGTYDLGGFNLTNFLGVQSAAISGDALSTGVITNQVAFQGRIRTTTGQPIPFAAAFEAVAPTLTALSTLTTAHGFRARNHGHAQVAEAYGFRCDPFTASPTQRPFQDEGSTAGDAHGNRFRSNTQFGSLVGAFGGGDGVIGVANAVTVPTTNPAGGGVAFAEGGEARWWSAAGVKHYLSHKPQVAVTHSANQSIASGGVPGTILAFDSERWDTDAMHDNVTNNSRLTAPVQGVYQIAAHVAWNNESAAGRRLMEILLNGVTIIARSDQAVNEFGAQSVATQYRLAAGDYVQVRVFQNSGVAVNIVAGGNYSPEFRMKLAANY